MRDSALEGALDARLEAQVQARTEANREFFAGESERLARLCHAMAERFARGGRLIASGGSPTARSERRPMLPTPPRWCRPLAPAAV